MKSSPNLFLPMAMGTISAPQVPVRDYGGSKTFNLSPLVRARMEESKPLFAHLLLQAHGGYELFTFEILADGTIEPLSNEPIADPSIIGLPSAQ